MGFFIKVRSYFFAFTGEGHVTPLPFCYGFAKADPFLIPPLRSAQKQELTFLINERIFLSDIIE